MADNRLAFAEALVRKTDEGKVAWTTAAGESFKAQIGKNVVSISVDEDEAGNTIFVLTVYDKEGEVVEIIQDDTLSRLSGKSWRGRLAGLFNTARRNATGADRLINEILEELTKDDDEIPF